jgi:type VI secretion system secreted protein Hcp
MGNMFLKLTNFHGESLDHKHHGEIEIHDWGWKIENHAPFRLGEDMAKQAQVDHITIDKFFDKSTTTLMDYCANGRQIPHGLITCRKNAGDSQVEFLKIKLTDVKIEKVDWSDKGDKNLGIREGVELSFLAFEIEYYRQNNVDGDLGGINSFHFVLPTHKGQKK